jgi:primosomal protein N' (replication factor Y) (superfamily II helicase)
MANQDIFADIILPLPATGIFTYHIPDRMKGNIIPGMRVIVPFGSRKFYSGIVKKIHQDPPQGFKIRDIESAIDPFPVVNSYQLDFWEWISGYYLCTQGEVLKAALPSGLKAESETKLFLMKMPEREMVLSAEESKLITALERGKGKRLKEISISTGIKHPEKAVHLLIQKGLISAEEKLSEKYQPKTEMYIRLNKEFKRRKEVSDLLNSLKRAQKQYNLLNAIIQEWNVTSDKDTGISRKIVQNLSGFSDGTFRTLVNKKILAIHKKVISRLESIDLPKSEPRNLTTVQKVALEKINQSFLERKVVLLHGVTSGGKTEIYFHLIRDQIRQGKQVLYLLPEIVLTAQIIRRLRLVFGNQVGIYHSRYSDAERVETWFNLIKDSEDHTIRIILGARSAIFLPFNKLGLIIIDEEHENTYKQSEPAPRYHARDAAIMLASMHNANVVLGTATPSFETYYNALSGKYGLVTLNERYGKIELPEIRVVNIREQYRKKLMKSHFSDSLLEELVRILKEKQQVILFQNRRGFSSYLECQSCGWIPRCRTCDVSLTYHKQKNQMVCHYCGYSVKLPGICDNCHEPALRTRGFGTEKIEEELSVFFPGINVIRFDLDTAHSKKQYERIIQDFEEEKTDILVGTQIISKGLDFDNVGLVGILNADNLLNFPDFRAYERSYQLLSQVAGRAGRKFRRGTVIIQTSDPENVVIRNVITQDFNAFYETQMNERKIFNYPPYNRLIYITLKHRNFDILTEMAGCIAKDLVKTPKILVLGPQQPVIGKIKNWYIQNILVKLPRAGHLNVYKERIRTIIHHYSLSNKFKGIQFFFDVDPY